MGTFFDGDSIAPNFLADIEGKAQSTDEKYMEATVTSAELVSQSRYASRNQDYALVMRFQQLAQTYGTMNSTVASGMKLRAYAPARSPTAKKHHRRPIKAKARNKYLRSFDRGGPGHKAADFADKSGDIVELFDFAPLRLIENPNPMMRGRTWMFHGFMQWQMLGRCYTHLVVKNGVPVELWPMLGQFVRIVPSRDGLIGGYWYGRDGVIEDIFEPDEVMYHRFRPSPFNPYDSIGPMHAVVQELDIYAAATIAELAMWQNQGRPDWVFPIDPETTEDQMKQLKAELAKMYGGPRNRGKVLLATLGKDPKPLQFTPKEMEYVIGLERMDTVIRRAFGIPDSMAAGNDHNLSSAAAGDTQHARDTIAPMLAMYAEEYTETLLYEHFGIEPGTAWLAFDNPVPEDDASIREDIKVYVQGPKQVWTVNEARAKLGDEPMEGQDELVASEPDVPPGEDKPPKKDGKALEVCPDCVTTTEPNETPARSAVIEGKAIGPLMSDVSEGSNPSETLVQSLFRTVSEWLAMVARDVDIPDTTDEFTGEQLQPFVSQLISSLNAPIEALLMEAGRVGAYEIGKPSPVINSTFITSASEYVKENNLRLAGSVTQTQTDAIKSIMSDSIAKGESQGQMSASVRTVLEGERVTRATTIARTESDRAHQAGKQMAWQKAGYWGSRWVLAPGACPVCVAFVEQYGFERAMGEPFAVVGDTITIDGKDKPVELTYDDVYGPPLHVACRCFLEPVMIEPPDAPIRTAKVEKEP